MLVLSRQVRLFWPIAPTIASPTSSRNRWASVSAFQGMPTYLRLDISLVGLSAPQTGFLINIKEIDQATERALLNLGGDLANGDLALADISEFPQRLSALLSEQLASPTSVETYSPKTASLPRPQLFRVCVHYSPQVSVLWHSPLAQTWKAEMDSQITLTQQYEFSAAHRLACDEWTDEENRQVFGKCSFPSGHGHNYLLEVTVGRIPPERASLSDSALIDQWVKEAVLDKVDHRFLNLDVPEFQALNPTVENIATVVFQWLTDALPPNYVLENVRVYETAKTWADCSRMPSANPTKPAFKDGPGPIDRPIVPASGDSFPA